MDRVTWTRQAASDLEAICDFIARDAPPYASAFATRVMTTVRDLRNFPESGRVVPEIGDKSIREKIVGNYRIIYRVRSQSPQILAVLHGAQLLTPERLQDSQQ